MSLEKEDLLKTKFIKGMLCSVNKLSIYYFIMKENIILKMVTYIVKQK